MLIPVQSPWLPGYINVAQTILIVLTMAALFLDRLYIYDYIYIYDEILLLCYKKNKALPFVTVWMDLEGIMQSEISLSENEKCHMISVFHLYMESKEQNK